MGHHPEIITRALKPDITNRQDIIKLLEHFYDKLLKDDITSHIFKDLDMPAHIPVIADFWSMILLGELDYKGNPFEKHIPLELKKEHFDCWLKHFNSSVDHFFSGEKATLAKQRANSIAFIFQSKLNKIS